METVRLRLVFEDRHILTKTQKSEGLKRSWFLLKPDLDIISDLASLLTRTFDLQHTCPNGILLSMDGFVLPPFESTHIFKDKDIIRVKRKASMQTDVFRIDDEANSLEDSEIVEKQLLALDEFEKVTGGNQSEPEENEYDGPEDALHLETPSSGKTTSKKRKSSKKLHSAKRKRTKYNSPEKSPKVSIEAAENDIHKESNQGCHLKGVFSLKSSNKKDRSSKTKGKLNMASTTEVVNRSTSVAESMPSEVRCDQLQETGNKDVEASCVPEGTKKFPSRSARRKKAKRKWLREIANSQKKEVPPGFRRPIHSHMPEKAIPKESLEHHQSDNNTDTEAEIVPIVVRPGHIRFEPLDEDEVIQQTQDPVGNFQWNGTTSKKKGQKWGIEKTSASRSNSYKDPREDTIEKLTIEEGELIHDPVDFEKLKPLSCLPKEGAVVAYRLVELSSSWCPELSSFRVGKVLWYDSASNRVMLVPVPEYPIFPEEKIDEEADAPRLDASLYREDGSLEIDFPSLIDVRMFNQDNKDSATKVTSGSSEAPVCNKEVLAVRLNDNNEDTHAPIIENGGPINVWEEISQALTEKKTQLLHKDDWTEKESSGRRPWAYKALRSSALGPTMALLRAGNDL